MSAPASRPSPLPVDWQERLRDRLLSEPDHLFEHCHIGTRRIAELAPSLRQRLNATLPAQPQAAAVLVPIVMRADGPTLLLTVRAVHLRRHGGQISFPGGAIEGGAEEPTQAAVRETGEELGILPEYITPIGFLSDHLVRTGYLVTPVVALLRTGFQLRPQTEEVADAFEMPLSHALSPGNFRARRQPLPELDLGGWELVYGERTIWGATAGMVAQLAQLLDGESSVPTRRARAPGSAP